MILLLAICLHSGLFMFMFMLDLRDCVGGLEGAFSGLCSMVEEVEVEVEVEVGNSWCSMCVGLEWTV
jgi:hypothetical protein